MRVLKISAGLLVILAGSGVMLALLSLRGLPAAPGGGVEVPAAGSGADVNCDSKVTIADAIYILRWLFQSGPPPCAEAQDTCCPELAGDVKDMKDAVVAIASRQAPRPQDTVSIVWNQKKAVQYIVPAGKYLIITDLHKSSGSLFEVTESTPPDDVRIVIPAIDSILQMKTGIVFSPGKEVSIYLVSGQASGLLMSGYLVDA